MNFQCSAAIFKNNLRNMMKKGRPLGKRPNLHRRSVWWLSCNHSFQKIYKKKQKYPPKHPQGRTKKPQGPPKHFQERPKDLSWTPKDPLRTKNTRKYHNPVKENVKKHKHEWKVTKRITDTRTNVNTNIIFQTERSFRKTLGPHTLGFRRPRKSQ